MAVIVTDPALSGAVNRPDESIVPASVVQVTDESKFPLPVTRAEQVEVWSLVTAFGSQVTVTDAMLAGGLLFALLPPPPPPPQPAVARSITRYIGVLFSEKPP